MDISWKLIISAPRDFAFLASFLITDKLYALSPFLG